MASEREYRIAEGAVEAVALIAKNIGRVATSIGRLAAAVETANERALASGQASDAPAVTTEPTPTDPIGPVCP